MMAAFLFLLQPSSIIMFKVTILQKAVVATQSPNIIAHEKHAHVIETPLSEKGFCISFENFKRSSL